MSKRNKKTKNILILLVLLLIAVIGGTVAYYFSKKDFSNEFRVPEPGVAIQERFSPADSWVPGEEKKKEVWFTNTGEMDMLLRFSVEAEWASDSHPNVDPNNVITLFWNQGNETRDAQNPPVNFQIITDGNTKYYYYTKILEAGKSTEHVLESVKFSSELSNDGHKNSDYSNTQINLTIKGETVLVDEAAVAEQWPGRSYSVSNGTVTWK